MFTWICPKCGGEVPPAHSECPRCVAAAAAATAPVAAETPAPVEAAPPPPPAVPARTDPMLDTRAGPPPTSGRRGVPPLLVALLSGAGILGLLAILYMYVLPNAGGRSEPDASAASPQLESPGQAGSGRNAHPLTKYLEVSGIRIQGEKDGRVRIQMLVINHSNAELPAMKMEAELVAGDRGLFDFDVNLPTMGPYESREVSTVLKTNLKPYEMPDWQQIRPRFQLAEVP